MQPSNNLKTVIKIESSQQVTYENQHNCSVQTAQMIPPSKNKSDHNQSSKNVNFRSQWHSWLVQTAVYLFPTQYYSSGYQLPGNVA
jgi:hypothetical protein